MARVVCVHGVGKQQLGERQLLKDWIPALLDGLTRAGADGRLAHDHIEMAFYGDLWDLVADVERRAQLRVRNGVDRRVHDRRGRPGRRDGGAGTACCVSRISAPARRS
ncbi:hypothetical protein [Sphaerisporangium dianthi]|uniref:Uncharacterized protein n=1 Tax=Sphaerisporangium dianthi TaxID=1436120 RepID=A0ABV9CH84_9ACTN